MIRKILQFMRLYDLVGIIFPIGAMVAATVGPMKSMLR
jgi:hypothetical protein